MANHAPLGCSNSTTGQSREYHRTALASYSSSVKYIKPKSNSVRKVLSPYTAGRISTLVFHSLCDMMFVICVAMYLQCWCGCHWCIHHSQYCARENEVWECSRYVPDSQNVTNSKARNGTDRGNHLSPQLIADLHLALVAMVDIFNWFFFQIQYGFCYHAALQHLASFDYY